MNNIEQADLDSIKQSESIKGNDVIEQKDENGKEELENKLLEEADTLYQDTIREYENYIEERIKKYQDLINKINGLSQEINVDDVDKLLKLSARDYSSGSIDELISYSKSVQPYEKGLKHPQIEKIANNVFSKYKEKIESLKSEAQKQGIELVIDKSPVGSMDNGKFYELINFDKENAPVLESLPQKKKDVEEKIRGIVSSFLDDKMAMINKLEQDYKGMPEQVELINLESKYKEIFDKKTGMFFSEKKKNEQLIEIQNQVDTLKSNIHRFLSVNGNSIRDELRNFEGKFDFQRYLFDDKKCKSIWSKINSL